MLALGDRAARVRDAGGGVAGRLHHHLDVRRLQHRRRIVGEARRGDALVAPADAPACLARAVRRQVGDRRDLDAGRGRHLREEHRAELAGADQRRRAPAVRLQAPAPAADANSSATSLFSRAVSWPIATPGLGDWRWRDTAEVEWRKLRADQLREMARADAIVILPVASLEQHGPHLPVEVDSMLGETVAVRAARKIAERGQQAVVLPVLWTGLSEHHMSFGGTDHAGLSRIRSGGGGRLPLGAAAWLQADRAAERAWRQRERAAHHHR